MPPPTAASGAEAHAALRNAGWVVAQRGLQIAIGALFALLVPRLMGPLVFGQYALITSVSLWFALLSGLGAVSMMTRSVPTLVARGDFGGLQKLVSGLVTLRFATGFITGVGYLVLTTIWLRDIDAVALGFMAAAVFIRTPSNVCFALFLGLNQAGRWGMGELLRRSLTLVFVVLGFNLAGLRGACAGWFAANTFVLFIGLWMGRDHLRWSAMWPDRHFMAPFLRTGVYFAGGNILLTISQRTGESLVHLTTHDFTQVGYFGVAYGMFAAGTQALWHVAVAFAPLLIFWNERGDTATSAVWTERLLAWLTVAAMAGVIAVVFIGDMAVTWLLGAEFLPAASSFVPLSIAFVAVAVSSVGRLQTLVADRPGVSATAAGVELATFWIAGWLLATGAGSVGACVAVLAGAMMNAGYLAWALRRERPYSHKPAVQAALLGLPVLPLVWFAESPILDVALLIVALAGYAALLLGTRVVTIAELGGLVRSLRRGRELKTPIAVDV